MKKIFILISLIILFGCAPSCPDGGRCNISPCYAKKHFSGYVVGYKCAKCGIVEMKDWDKWGFAWNERKLVKVGFKVDDIHELNAGAKDIIFAEGWSITTDKSGQKR